MDEIDARRGKNVQQNHPEQQYFPAPLASVQATAAISTLSVQVGGMNNSLKPIRRGYPQSAQ